MFNKFWTLAKKELARLFNFNEAGIHFIMTLLPLAFAGALIHEGTAGTLFGNLSKIAEFPVAPYLTPIVIACTVWLFFLNCRKVIAKTVIGDRENGTLARLMITPASKSAITGSKLVTLFVISIISILAFFFGFMSRCSATTHSVIHIIQKHADMIAVICTAVPMSVAVCAVIAITSEDSKDASTAIFALSLLAVIYAFVFMLDFNRASFGWRLIPVFNVCLTIGELLIHQASALNIAVTCGTNLLCAILLLSLWAGMFQKEKYTLIRL